MFNTCNTGNTNTGDRKMKEYNKIVSFRIDLERFNKIKRCADKTQTPLTKLIFKALDDFIDNYIEEEE